MRNGLVIVKKKDSIKLWDNKNSKFYIVDLIQKVLIFTAYFTSKHELTVYVR